MRFLEIETARKVFPRLLGQDGKPPRTHDGMTGARFYFGSEVLANVYWLALRLINAVGPWEDAWLWIDSPDTWKRNGLHLYNRLRCSYGDCRLIQEAPIHYFHGYEEADLTAFLVVGLLNEWPMYLYTSHDYGRVLVSQNAGAEVWVQHVSDLQSLTEELKTHGLELIRIEP